MATEQLLELLNRAGVPAVSVAARVGNSDELAAPWLREKYAGELGGTHPLTVGLTDGRTIDVIAKIRSDGGISKTLMPRVYEQLGIELPLAYSRFRAAREMASVLDREINIYRLQPEVPPLASYQPRYIGSVIDEATDLSVLVLEFIREPRLMDTGAHVTGWTNDDVELQLSAIGQVHGSFLRPGARPSGLDFLPESFTAADVAADADFWHAGVEFVRVQRPDLLSAEGLRLRERLITSAADWYGPVEAHPHTLVHDDFNPRNACFRRVGRPVIYDWELAMWGVPQRDLVEMMMFTTAPEHSDEYLRGLVTRQFGLVASNRPDVDLSETDWWEAFRGEVFYQTLNRLVFQQTLGETVALGYVERITGAMNRLLRLVG
ncbi:MAG: phosphotransferase [Candidatus Nanopelagicales bacterium]